MTLSEIEKRIERIPESGCWIWMGKINNQGYGRICLPRNNKPQKTVPAHRAIYETYGGLVQSGLQLCHRCDIRCCVNPDHLFQGTQQDNTADMMRKGRDRFGVWQKAKTQCKWGHPFDAENTFMAKTPTGYKYRRCRICLIAATRRYKLSKEK